jgi:lipopolysaccharide export system ATP-binding protein
MSNIKKFRIKSFKSTKPILKLEKISIKFGKKIILDNLNFSLNKGQILGLLGPNGVGKSTIFNIITGLISPDFGSISINSEIINRFPVYQRTLRFKIGYVPQYGGYFHDLTVYENLLAIGELCMSNLSYRNEKINLLISNFELDSVRNIRADFLSGGQKKKLTIALSLISSPKILLLDEPFAALDILTIKTLQKIIVNLQITEKISVILCDHQARDLLACVDEAIIINNGKVIAQGTPKNLVENINAREAYFGDTFRIV